MNIIELQLASGDNEYVIIKWADINNIQRHVNLRFCLIDTGYDTLLQITNETGRGTYQENYLGISK